MISTLCRWNLMSPTLTMMSVASSVATYLQIWKIISSWSNEMDKPDNQYNYITRLQTYIKEKKHIYKIKHINQWKDGR